MHCWGMVNHPSAGNFSNEVDGDCSWNPERPLCHCSSCEVTGEEAVHSVCLCISMHCFQTQSPFELVPTRGRETLSYLHTALAFFARGNICRET